MNILDILTPATTRGVTKSSWALVQNFSLGPLPLSLGQLLFTAVNHHLPVTFGYTASSVPSKSV